MDSHAELYVWKNPVYKNGEEDSILENSNFGKGL